MPTYTVHQPPPRKGETVAAPERFKFVRDGFYFWAFLLTPLWLLVHRLWLAFAIYLVGTVLLGFGFHLIRVGPSIEFLAWLLIALAIGFEAASIWRWKLTRRGWKMLGFVVGEDAEMAERRFFAEWNKRGGEAPVSPAGPPPSQYSVPVWRAPLSSPDVIGLFPEPEPKR